MDEYDRQILRLIQLDNRKSSASIGQEIGLSVSAVNERVRRLNTSGIVQANRAVIDPSMIGLSLCAYLFVDLDTRCDDEDAFVSGAVELPEVQEIHHITGGHNYLLKVRVADTLGLQTLLSEKLKRLPGLLRTESTVVLQSFKETTVLPIATDPES
ncbi:MAG: Lrp/AsnC family transcriptional regulator, partial [Pseudomonadota bacterium]